jgi:hypothetical protein
MARPRSFRYVLAATATMLLLLICGTAQSQDIKVSPSESDSYAASQAQNVRHHARPANTPAGRAAGPSVLSNLHPANPGAGDPFPAVTRYPGDLEYQGGNVVPSVQMHLIYVNLGSSPSCSTIATCWGNPRRFLSDLGESTFIHVTDQYVGSTENGRYTVSERAIHVTYPTTANPLTDNDMIAIVHAVALSLRGIPTGYGNLYHIFLVPGQDECFDSTYTQCYSPDNPKSWVFCAYHSSADLSDIGHILYSVEPFQDVNPGCGSRPGTPNGQLADSTNNVLSHETFETITDPDGTAWWNSLDNGLYGQEIGDECSFLVFTASGAVYFDPANVTLNGRPYVAQPEYNNSAHACTTAP